MKVEVVETIKNDNIDMIRFVLEDVSLELANGFRRIILSEVPCMAVDEVIFLENDSPLFDEIIAHRLGLIPLKSDIENYNLPNQCDCGGVGCTLCRAELTCTIQADLDGTLVKSKDLISTDPNIVPVNDKIIIAKLQKGSSLEFEAYTRLGIGRDHAKWQPVSTVGFGNFPDVTIDSKKCQSCSNQCIAGDRCPESLIKFGGNKAKLIKEYWKECTVCKSCAKYCPEEAIEVNEVSNKFIFVVEGTGALPIKTILIKALEIFQEKVEEFQGNLANKELFGLEFIILSFSFYNL
ncbi:MAG: DNA-directed RNA polymerase subunit D [Candidatus Lokiarchaeota archaeon]|nr:DNA-directed RNA polymerase subunit D [Candidatus Lokiarchaeota archaeon]